MVLEHQAAARRASLSSRHRVGPQGLGSGRAVAVIGAGFSGTMAAIHLRHALPPDCTVFLFDRTGRFARGPAYAHSEIPHLLNVRSVNMSALPDDPGHFERWLADRALHRPDEAQATAAGTFATRRAYGRYLRALLYEEMSLSGGRVRLCADEPVAARPVPGGWCLRCSSGREVAAAAVVLAVGNLPSSRPSDGLVFFNPWDARATADLRPDEAVLIVGTGLTMVDLVLAMASQGFAGPIVALSRRGLVPQRHGEPQPPLPCDVLAGADRRSLVSLLRAVRGRVREVQALGGDWRAVIDGLRPMTASLWLGLPKAERDRFLQHLRPFWDVHRHRMAPGPADEFARLVQRGVVRLQRGRVRAVRARPDRGGAEVEILDRGGCRDMVVQRVIHATGIGAGAANDGLIAGLIGAGLARTDHHGLGLEVTEALGIVDRAGGGSAAMWALGPIVRGVFWECTAVPDIRVQARTVAAEVAQHLGTPG